LQIIHTVKLNLPFSEEKHESVLNVMNKICVTLVAVMNCTIKKAIQALLKKKT